jgi:3-hydroxy-9,10-secoandrosta-1,3,5(10)-triene-9,17-dione monooxygenase
MTSAATETPKNSIPLPEPDMTPERLIARARGLRARVQADAALAEKRGRYSQALHEQFQHAGFYRILQPRRFGGYEFDVPTFFRVMIEIASADPGIGWCLCLGAGHALLLASHFSESAQVQIFGPTGHFVAPFSAGGSGANCTALPVAGGYRVSGTWRYCSGVPYSTHFMGVAKIPAQTPRDLPETVVVVVPSGSYRMLEDWGDILGLRASGSNSVVIEDVFIPSEFISKSAMRHDATAPTPGTEVNPNPMYRSVFLAFAAGELVCSQVGAAKAALADFERIITSTRPRFAPSVKKFEHHDWQRIFGLAMAMTDAAEAVLLKSGEQFMELCRDNAAGTRAFDFAAALRIQGLQHQAARLAWEAGVEMFRSASSTSSKDGEPMQRFFRDLATFRSNASHQPDFVAQQTARAYFGLPTDLDF